MTYYAHHVLICTNQKVAGKQCCAATGGTPFFEYMKSKLLELDKHGPGKIRVSTTGCLGRCGSGPGIVIYPEGVWYTYNSFADIDLIIESHFLKGTVATDLLMDR